MAADRQEGIVIGCDSILDLNGERLGKPSAIEEVGSGGERWRANGVLLTGHCLIDVGTRIRRRRGGDEGALRDPTADELESYFATDEPLQVAGAFTIDGLAGPFVDGVVGDPHNVLGLSLPLLRRLLADLGSSCSSCANRDRLTWAGCPLDSPAAEEGVARAQGAHRQSR